MSTNTATTTLLEVAARIREMREIMGWSTAEMAEKTEVTEAEYLEYENAKADLPFTFIHKCALAFEIDLTDLLEGRSAARLSSYTLTRKGMGQVTAREIPRQDRRALLGKIRIQRGPAEHAYPPHQA